MFTFGDYATVYPFEKFEEQIEVPVYKNGKVIKKFWIAVCKKFSPEKLPEQYTSALIVDKKTIKQGFVELDDNIFKFFNSKIKNKFFDFVVSCFSYFDNKGINLGLILMIIFSLSGV